MNRRVTNQTATTKIFGLGLTFAFVLLFFLIAGNFVDGADSKVSAMTQTSKYYTSIQVETGDTLWDIAQSHMSSEYGSVNDYIQEVCQLNHIDQDKITAGAYITIPYYRNARAM